MEEHPDFLSVRYVQLYDWRLARGMAPDTGGDAARDAKRIGRWAHARREALRVDQVIDYPRATGLPISDLADIAADLASALTVGFVLAFPDAPFILALRPETDEFFRFLDEGTGTRRIRLAFQYDEEDQAGTWVLSSAEDRAPLARLGIPPILDAWIFAVAGEEVERALHVKRSVLSTMTVYREGRAVQLEYAPFVREVADVAYYADEQHSPIRQEHRVPPETSAPKTWEIELAEIPPPNIYAEYADVADAPPWPVESLERLLLNLDHQAPVQAEVLRSAARNGGVISRDEVYRIGQYPRERSLRGFTRPIRRLCNAMAAEGLVPESALYPLSAWYPRPGRAAWFMMPPDVAQLLRNLDN